MHVNIRKVILNLEELEGRCTPAGFVGVSFVNGQLALLGDNLSNVVIVTQDDSGQLIVQGAAGTLVNGQTAPLQFGAVDVIRLDSAFQNGNDLVVVNGLRLATALGADLGPGNDTLSLNNNAVLGSAGLALGQGADAVVGAFNSVGQDMSLVNGGGNMLVNLSRLNVGGNAGIIGSSGVSQIFLTTADIGGSLAVTTGPFLDQVVFNGVNTGFCSVNTADGNDLVYTVGLNSLTNVQVLTGGGNDNVVLAGTRTFGEVRAAVGSGSDLVQVVNVAAGSAAVFDGEEGNDTFATGGFTAPVVDFRRFEHVLL